MESNVRRTFKFIDVKNYSITSIQLKDLIARFETKLVSDFMNFFNVKIFDPVQTVGDSDEYDHLYTSLLLAIELFKCQKISLVFNGIAFLKWDSFYNVDTINISSDFSNISFDCFGLCIDDKLIDVHTFGKAISDELLYSGNTYCKKYSTIFCNKNKIDVFGNFILCVDDSNFQLIAEHIITATNNCIDLNKIFKKIESKFKSLESKQSELSKLKSENGEQVKQYETNDEVDNCNDDNKSNIDTELTDSEIQSRFDEIIMNSKEWFDEYDSNHPNDNSDDGGKSQGSQVDENFTPKIPTQFIKVQIPEHILEKFKINNVDDKIILSVEFDGYKLLTALPKYCGFNEFIQSINMFIERAMLMFVEPK
jgi:hypothetical protein